MSPDQKGIETDDQDQLKHLLRFTMSPDQKGIETRHCRHKSALGGFTMSPDQKGIETVYQSWAPARMVHNEPRSKGD